jgi:hypothetical protein
LSRNAPRNGVSNIAPIGNHEKSPAACYVGILRFASSIPVANFWNGKIAE